MKISNDFVLRSIMDEFVIVPVGEAALRFSGVISTNGTGAFLWNLLSQDVTPEFLRDKLVDEYDVTPEKAIEDVLTFLDQLRKHRIITDD